MTFEPRTYDTELATLTRVRPDLLEIRYKPGITFNTDGVTEVQATRRKAMGRSRYGVLTIIPEDVDYRLETMRQDHAHSDRSEGLVVATAVVAHADMLEMMVKLYFSYFPPLHRIHVTDKEPEARTWLDAQLEGYAGTGS